VGASSVAPSTAASGAASTTAGNPVDPTSTAAGLCVEGRLRSCLVHLPTQGSVQNCFSGEQLCSGGVWTSCQAPGALVGARAQNFVASCPAAETARWTMIDYEIDAPSNASGAAAVTIGVAEHPEVVLLDTRSANGPGAGKTAATRPVEAVLAGLASQSTLMLEITTTTTPDGEMAATATVTAVYDCVPKSAP
jgi:hypothetical protein